MKLIISWLLALSVTVLVGCSSTRTAIYTDTTVGSRIGQVALTQAMDNAFAALDTFPIKGKKVLSEVTYLGDLENAAFYKAYLDNKLLLGNAIPINDVDKAEIKCSLLIKVGGIDEQGANYYVTSTEYVQSQFEAIVTYTDIQTGELIKSQPISGQSRVDRSGSLL